MMNTKWQVIQLFIITGMASLLLSSCEFSKFKIGEVRMMVGSNEDGHISYNFSTFTGFERGRAQVLRGETIKFDYQAKIDNGTLQIEWQEPSGTVIWQKAINGSVQGSEDFLVEIPGEYVIIVQGKDAGGNFDVTWKIE
jgi:hypothetical protein